MAVRVRNDEFNLLVEICEYLKTKGSRIDLTEPLENMISRFSNERRAANERQRMSHAKNRANGYSWPSSYHPKKSKYYSKGDQNE